MRRAWCIATVLAISGCSLLFDGKDLHGKAGGSNDLSMLGGVNDLAGADLAPGPCTPRSTVKFTVKSPNVDAMSPYEVALSDIDKDGKLDIVTANYNSNNFSVLLGDGHGSFTLASSTPVSTCSVPQVMITRDVTGDTLDDVIISCFDNSGAAPVAAVNVYVNQSTPGTVSFSAAKPVTMTWPAALNYVVAGNFDSTPGVDLMIVDYSATAAAHFFSGKNNGTFTATMPTYPTGKYGSWSVAGNLNGDALDDVIVWNSNDQTMTMLLSKVGSNFTTTTLAYDATAMMGTLYFVNNPPTLIDINRDGLLDILVASGSTQPGTIEKYLNTGSATAPAFPTKPVDIATGDAPVAQGFADFNCDGVLDIAISTNGCDAPSCSGPEPPNMWIMLGHGTGYDSPLATGIPVGADSLAIADFNGDGYPDIVAGTSTGTVTVLINTP